MPRHNGASGVHHTRRQKGYARRGSGIGSYARENKARKAIIYDRPYLTGNYSRKDI